MLFINKINYGSFSSKSSIMNDNSKENWYQTSNKDKGPWRINVYEIRRGYIPCNSLEEADRVFLEVQDETNKLRHQHYDRVIYKSTDRTFGPRIQGIIED